MQESGTGRASAGAGGRGHGFGTRPVFLAGISTILGAILFLRFGYAVGHVGATGALLVVLLGHLVTIPTALALAEIATNRRVEGGGEYYIISRSFGTTIGSVIGASLYVSQAVSVAFYMIAFAEAFRPLAPLLEQVLGQPFDPRLISMPATLLLVALIVVRGAALGVGALYVVVTVLLSALALFFLGAPVAGFDPEAVVLTAHTRDPDPFITVFAIVFPAFTGMTAGVGLSGDLTDPRHSIPRGTLGATLTGLVVYLAVVLKLAYSAPIERLAGDPLIMADIALWPPIIPIGLACATLSSAIGSFLVAPRTLQALGRDRALPGSRVSHFLGSGRGRVNEPRNASLVTGVLALAIVWLGSVDLVARLISMFFMITYGSICAISFLEHFAARPSYRPSFRSRWYLSLFGALTCLLMMFQMDPLFAVLALVTMVALYASLSAAARRDGKSTDLGLIFEGVMTQLARDLHVRLQRRSERPRLGEWRPSIICVNGHTFERAAPIELLSWLCLRQGFGTYLHHIEGTLDADTHGRSMQARHRLLEQVSSRASGLYVDTIVSPSLTSAVAQALQVPGISGLPNNAALFDISLHDAPSTADEVARLATFAAHTDMAVLVLRHGDAHFGDRSTIHVWITWDDDKSADLMILLAYIILGHPDWARADLRVFAALPSEQVETEREVFASRIAEERIPVASKNTHFLAANDPTSYREQVVEHSRDADLVLVGFDLAGLGERGGELFADHPQLRDVLFVCAPRRIALT